MTETAERSINFYAGARLDRQAHARRDAEWIARRLAEAETRLVPLWRGENLIRRGTRPKARLPRLGDVPEALAAAREVAFLGVADGAAYFAIEIPDDAEAVRAKLAAHGEFAGLRTVGAVLDGPEAALLAYARGLLHWHGRTRFCAACGAPTRSAEAGHVRLCTNDACATQHHPRTDPAVIMLVHAGDECLLGRQRNWPRGMYSTLAGFVEPGESLEEAVAREVREEAGIGVVNVRYHSSQPWPFPASLMVGFTAEAETKTLAPTVEELEDVRWVTRAWLRARHDELEFRLPPALSIARRLIEDWVGET